MAASDKSLAKPYSAPNKSLLQLVTYYWKEKDRVAVAAEDEIYKVNCKPPKHFPQKNAGTEE
jgi:hypothetical protein